MSSFTFHAPLWQALALALEEHGREIEDGRILASKLGVRGVESLCRGYEDGSWFDEALALDEKLESLGRLLRALREKVEAGDVYDVDQLRETVCRAMGAREAQIARIRAYLDRPLTRRRTDLFRCHVAGTSFRSLERVLHADGSVAVEAAEDELAVGQELRFEREPGNRYDDDAVRVLSSNDRWLGYLPRAKNEVVARLLDADYRIGAVVESWARHERGWLEIEMTVCFFEETSGAA